MFDALCHLQQAAAEADLLEQAWAAGLCGLLLGGTSPESWEQQQHLAAQDPRIRLALGLHPWWADRHPDAIAHLEDLLQSPNPPDAIGEIGLDRARAAADQSAYARQREVFDQQLALAARYQRPVVMHIVQAHGHALEHLRRRPLEAGGMIHGFGGAPEMALHYVHFGFHISFGHLLLSPHARKAREAARVVPLTRLLVESDAPGSLEGAHRLPDVLAALAALRGCPVEDLAAQTEANARRLYGVPGASGRSAG